MIVLNSFHYFKKLTETFH